ncbi:hypothetical protein NP493_88g01035 [Ridgeia piscesae]|uniref:CTCK domain-containing protein n=1 Tax=Ridgeia piscesae TaxID=27915 RepID=A0AAD9P8H6_RIDPI|nr:hypothetical protein NP493_88g01035 [Ridgeia piscesae]
MDSFCWPRLARRIATVAARQGPYVIQPGLLETLMSRLNFAGVLGTIHRSLRPGISTRRQAGLYVTTVTQGHECKSTWKVGRPKKLDYRHCLSIDEYKLKYCSTCKKRKCCVPGRTRTMNVDFQCPDGTLITERFMWIRNCECYKWHRCPS